MNDNDKRPVEKAPENPKTAVMPLSKESVFTETRMACRFLLQGIETLNERGVMVTFRHPPEEIRQLMHGPGIDIQRLEKQDKWRFVDVSPLPDMTMLEAGAFDLEALLARMRYAVRQIDAQRICLDGLATLPDRFRDRLAVCNEISRIVAALSAMDVTLFISSEEHSHGVVPGCSEPSKMVCASSLLIEKVPRNVPVDQCTSPLTATDSPEGAANRHSESTCDALWSPDDLTRSAFGYATK
jgi:hypothetical protein